jgi:nitrogenase molybdenum-iron protein alpha chain
MGLTTLGSKLGIPTLFEGDANYSTGYEGVIKMGRRFYEAVQTEKLVKNIAKHVDLPYTDWWLNEEADPFYFENGGTV